MAEFIRDCEKENAARGHAPLSGGTETPIPETWLKTDTDPPAVFIYPGNSSTAETVECFINTCGNVIMTNPTFLTIIEGMAFGPKDLDRIRYSIWRYFGQFILNSPAKSEAQGLAMARIWKIDQLIGEDGAMGYS